MAVPTTTEREAERLCAVPEVLVATARNASPLMLEVGLRTVSVPVVTPL